MKPCLEHEENIGLLATDALGGKDAEALKRHLEECPACNRRYKGLRRIHESLQMLAEKEPTTPLPAGLHERIMRGCRARPATMSYEVDQSPVDVMLFLRLARRMPRPRLRQLAMTAIIARRCDLAEMVERNPGALAQWLRKADTMTCQEFERVAGKGIAGSAVATTAAASAAAAMMAACTT